MEATRPSPLIRWLGQSEFEALAAGVNANPIDEAPRLVLADWLRDRGDDVAADEVRDAGSRLIGWLAMARFEQATGRSAAGVVPHLTDLFRTYGPESPATAEMMAAVRRAAAGVILTRAANGQSRR